MATATKPRVGTTLNVAMLKAALSDLSDAIPNRSPRPVLLNALLQDGSITGSDLQTRVTEDIGYDGEPLLLPFSRLRSILGECGADTVTLAVQGTVCIVKAGRSEWRLPVEDASEYPPWEPVGVKTMVRIPCDQFARAAWSVVGAADDTATAGGVLIEVAGDECWLVSTDGRRLYTCKIEHDQAVDEKSVVVPAKAMRLIAKLAGKQPDEAIQLDASTSELVAVIGTTTVVVRLAASTFPKWRRIIPEASGGGTIVDRVLVESATRSAAIVTSETSRGVRYTFGGELLLLEGKSSEAGESRVQCAVGTAGTACKVSMNPAYITDWLEELPLDAEPTVDIEATGSDAAVVLRCGEHLAVVMPLAEDA